MRLKWTIAALLGLLAVFSLQGQQKTYQLSSHILDIHTGQPAPEVLISLSKLTPQGASGNFSTKRPPTGTAG